MVDDSNTSMKSPVIDNENISIPLKIKKVLNEAISNKFELVKQNNNENKIDIDFSEDEEEEIVSEEINEFELKRIEINLEPSKYLCCVISNEEILLF